MSTIWEFDHIEDKHTLYPEKDSTKKFWVSLKEHAKSIIDFEDVCYTYGIRFLKNLSKNINYQKVRDDCHYTGNYREATHSICNLKLMSPIKFL